MDLLMVTDRWDPAGGGRERYLAELRASLTCRGCSIETIAGRDVGERSLQRRIEAVQRASLRTPIVAARPLGGATHYQLHSGVHACAYAAERDAFDSSLRRHLFWPALRVNRSRSRLLRIEERLLRDPAGPHLMVFSRRTRDELERGFGTLAGRITLARPGIDLRAFPSRFSVHASGRQRPSRVRLLFAGHNFVLKGLRWALEALALARRGGIDAELTVAGRGSVQTFARMARRLAIESHVRFAGAVSRDVLAQMYRDVDLLIHPTFYDPFPRVVLEAMASGCPVVTTQACGAAEIVSPGKNGFVVDDPRHVEGFSEAIAAVADRGRRAEMSVAAADVGRRYDFDAHVGDVIRWLERQ